MEKYINGYKWHVARAQRQKFKPLTWPQFVKYVVRIEIHSDLDFT